MRKITLNGKERKQIDRAVEHFSIHQKLFSTFAESLTVNLGGNSDLAPYIHFLKYRIKNPERLREKLNWMALERKMNSKRPDITVENLFERVTDLAGVRILHLHTEQMADINRIILVLLDEYKYPLIEGPIAICWDREYEALFRGFGIEAESRDSMYTSVHYIIEANQKKKIRAELQVRTLMEEVWGEVSHRVEYQSSSVSRVCRDQLKILARMTSGCTRLVDSIFKSRAEVD